MSDMLEKLIALYGEEKAAYCYREIGCRIANFKKKAVKQRSYKLDERDVLVITYGDQFTGRGRAPLKNLEEFSKKYLSELISCIHILPFFPYSSDDGFSVTDYTQVREELGDWGDIRDIGAEFKLMIDLVCNHVSAKSEWFHRYLSGDEAYWDFFIEMDADADLSMVARPRTSPLLTAFDTPKGKKYLWTTFSGDQVDLNYQNEKLLLRIIDVLLCYAGMGADLIRLDAACYLWKKAGTACIHLPETHTVIRLFKDVLDLAAPGVILVTETNVPHRDNIAYFGDGHNEAGMIYQFPLPPLMLYTLLKEDASVLSKWVDSLAPISDEATYLNFLASHDGIGVTPARELLREEDIGMMAGKVAERGGYVSYKKNPDGSASPYEFNISYFDALSGADDSGDVRIKRFLVAHAITMSLPGVPGIYIHSLLGSRNYAEGVAQTGRYRMINREKNDIDAVERMLDDDSQMGSRVFRGFQRMLKARRSEKAFHPNAGQRAIPADDKLFCLVRTSVDRKERLLAIHNISGERRGIALDLQKYELRAKRAEDIVCHHDAEVSGQILSVALDPYEFAWIRLYE
jgi:sucrose phosphorylase